MKTLYRTNTASLAALALLLCIGPAAADAFPNKPIRFVVPYAAGTTVDIRARQVAERISKPLGVAVLVENRPGAGATIGAAQVAKAPPDGYTILVGSVAEQAVAPAVYASLPYDPRKDFAPITQYAETAAILVANPDLGVSSMHELLALAKANPGKLSIGSWGNGTLTHLLSAQLNRLTGADIVHVPYKSSSQGLTDVAGGQLSLMWDYPVSSGPLIKAGRLKPLMVIGEQRVAPLPDVPSAAEAGLEQMRHKSWGGFFAPAGTPSEVIARLNAEIVRALRSPEMEEILAAQGSRVVTNSPEEFAAFVRREQDELAALAKAAGAKVD
jgi:tripartite-type tricarboxylate transporter receptor subunit TctC